MTNQPQIIGSPSGVRILRPVEPHTLETAPDGILNQ
jgi:hypothetical protein